MNDEEDDGGEKLQVDRKRLEAMMTGRPIYGTDITLPNAALFFEKVQCLSGARVLWPNQLKIGAKTKKDPYVKIIGTPEQTESARQLIGAQLQRRRDRVTLKMLIPHDSHSHIIGRGGRGSKRIMQDTGCHIHFPDANRHSNDCMDDTSKSDQVSITGSPEQVERARKCLRASSLVVVSFDLPWCSSSPPPLPTLLPQVTASVSLYSALWRVALRAAVADAASIGDSIDLITRAFAFRAPPSWTPQLTFECRIAWHRPNRCQLNAKIEDMARFENIRVDFFSDHRTFLLHGSLHGILSIRSFLISPLSIHFDCPNHLLPSDLAPIERAFHVEASPKRKTVDHTVVVLKATEEMVESLLRARERVLGLEESSGPLPPSPVFSRSQCDLLLPSLPSPVFDLPSPSLPHTLVGSAVNGFGASCKVSVDGGSSPSQDAFRSPDPDDSPIAHSLLKSAKELNKNSELWPAPSASPSDDPMSTRQQMLLKANKAVLDASYNHIRFPTDLWSGYGFSASLPAELIKRKAAMEQKMEAEAEEADKHEYDDYARSAAINMMYSPSSGGLASVLEDEELATYNSSTLDFSRKQRIPSVKRKPPSVFAASSSLFETAPNSLLGNDLPWDVDVFVDPSMVLAQLGCSEYLPQFRAQEIDMRALLLSDENSLKEIGVGTVGARKKIAHAILKLRESARSKGYDI